MNEGEITLYNESNFRISKPGTNVSVKEYTMQLMDKNVPGENFILDLKLESQEEMKNQNEFVCNNLFHNKYDRPISDESKDSDTLIICFDESDIDCDISDNEIVKNIDKVENNVGNFEECKDNQEISDLKQNLTNNNSCENYGSKIDRIRFCKCEDDFNPSGKDQKPANIRNENKSHEIYEENINLINISDSKIDFKLSKIEQQIDDIESDDPDILKIFYDESDIDSDYQSDSKIRRKSEETREIKSEMDENCLISVYKEVGDPDISVSTDAVSLYSINTLNYIEKDNNKLKSELNSCLTTEILQSGENTIPDYYEEEKEDLIRAGWNKIKSLSTDSDRCNNVAKCWQSPCVSDPNKNLTYYSFRKRFWYSKEDNIYKKRAQKRKASSSLNDQNTKRVRLCTYVADDRIKSIENERDKKIKELRKELNLKMQQRFQYHRVLEERLEQRHVNQYGTMNNYEVVTGAKLNRIRYQFEREIKNLDIKYRKKLKILKAQFKSKINYSYKRRREMLKFCHFYKISKKNSGRDPTLLTRDQQLILDEIENIYKQLDHFYSN